MVALLHAWVVVPLVLGLLAAGLGSLVRAAAGRALPGPLLLPVGLAALIVVAGALTTFRTTAPLAPWAASALALAGLALGLRRWRAPAAPGVRAVAGAGWPALAALGALLAFGAPALLSGDATFLGFLKLDDTATWFAFADHALVAGRALDALPDSTYKLVLEANVGTGYPIGAFLPLAGGAAVAGIDPAWAAQPYLACCAALLALVAYALAAPVVPSRPLRALVALVAAQPALLYGYALWGGMKEMTLAMLAMLLAAVTVEQLRRERGGWRELLPFAVVSAALTVVVGPGAVAFLAPPGALLGAVWWWRLRAAGDGRGVVAALRGAAARVAGAVALAVALALPVWATVGRQLSYGSQFGDEQTDRATLLGNLPEPLSALQLGGIWPAGDFRLGVGALPTVPLLALVAALAAGALVWCVARRRLGLPLYAALALGSCAGAALTGASPWLLGKALAIAAPAIPLAAATGAALVARRRPAAGLAALALVAGGVLWSNALAYHDATLAPRERLAELARVGELLDDRGPTLVNDYEVYATRHFLRRGAPVAPAEYRRATLPLRDGAILTKAARADLDAFALETLLPYRSIVVPRWPAESRPPSVYEPVWEGERYTLYRRPEVVPTVLRHEDLGDADELPFCGNAQNQPARALCPVRPVGVARCETVRALGREAAAVGGRLVAFERPAPLTLRADELRWPAAWRHDPAGRSLTATEPGTARGEIAVAEPGAYELWLHGTFQRGFVVRVDGKVVGRVENELAATGAGVRVADLELAAGAHRIELTYPEADLTPGAADRWHLTSVGAIALERRDAKRRLLTVPPHLAQTLCGRSLDWIEVVA